MGPVAHGGHCVARLEGRVVFVRHALPGELVRARLTEAGAGDRFWRAEAVDVLEPSADRVNPPCPLAVPGGCGGCDWQHASLPAQRRLKATVVVEQLTRLGRLPVDHPALAGLEVEPVPGDTGGLGWRTRVRFAVDPQGRPGFRRHRSHAVQPVDRCPIAHPRVDALEVGLRRWPGVSAVEVVAPATGHDRLVIVPSGSGTLDVPPLAAETSLAARADDGTLRRVRGRTWVQERVPVPGGERRFRVSGSGFWQVHPGAAARLVEAVLEAVAPRPGERALDLYCGAGLFSAALAGAVGSAGMVVGVESDGRAVADARRSLHDLPEVGLVEGRVERVLPGLVGPGGALPALDVAVLDPPRAGAGRRVLEPLLASAPRALAYVACDPAALARDVALAAGLGYRLERLRALDLFPMTSHVECVATLVPVR